MNLILPGDVIIKKIVALLLKNHHQDNDHHRDQHHQHPQAPLINSNSKTLCDERRFSSSRMWQNHKSIGGLISATGRYGTGHIVRHAPWQLSTRLGWSLLALAEGQAPCGSQQDQYHQQYHPEEPSSPGLDSRFGAGVAKDEAATTDQPATMLARRSNVLITALSEGATRARTLRLVPAKKDFGDSREK